MSGKEPIIKFSPFEALLIGEKNKILKRQPMKNTIFVTRLNHQRKTINLRDLFDLEKNTKTDNNDVMFKMPQRVCDFLRHRKLQNKINKPNKHEKGEVLCYEFEGCKVITKSNETLVPKNLNIRSKKVKFKQKFKYKDNLRHKIMKKFPNPTRRRNHYELKCKSLAIKTKNKKYNRNRHLLRGKDGKFICKKDYEKLNSKEISPKQKFLSNYIHQLYLKKNKEVFSSTESKTSEDSSDVQPPYHVGVPNFQLDTAATTTGADSMSENYYKTIYKEDFQFPKYPNQLQPADFESDSNLIDIIYENFPKIIKFESGNAINDFSCALLNSQILKPEQNLKFYEKKKNGFVKDEEISEILERQFPIIKLKGINGIVPHHYPLKSERHLYPSKIDEPYTKKNHLITGKSFGSFFFRSAEGKDIFIGNLLKPFWQNSWFGSLPES